MTRIIEILRKNFYTLLLIGVAFFIAFFSAQSLQSAQTIHNTQQLYQHLNDPKKVEQFVNQNIQVDYVSQPNVFENSSIINEAHLLSKNLSHDEFLKLRMQKMHCYATPHCHSHIKNRPLLWNSFNRIAHLFYSQRDKK